LIRKLTENTIVVGEGGSSNTTIISGRNCLIIVDTSLFPEKALKIRKFSQEIFGKPISLVINTHYHPDHTFGNAAFEDVNILSSKLTKEFMEQMDINYIEKIWGKEDSKKYHVSLPNSTFEEKLSLSECGVKIKLCNLGGHTPDSTIIFLEKEGILIAGDLIFNNYHLEITDDSNIEDWKNALNILRDLSPFFVVPGHGEVGGLDLIKSTKDYLMRIEAFVEGKISKEELISDKNFSEREFPELFVYSVENIFKILARF